MVEKKTYTTIQETEDLLNQLQIPYKKYEHEYCNTVEDMIKYCQIDKGVLIKNLFYVDKKKNYYLLCAKSDTQVGKNFWKNLGTSGSSEEQLLQVLKVKRGSVNGFALANDTENLVKYIIVDKYLMNFEYWAFHPMSSNATIELKRDDFVDKYVKDFTKKLMAEVQLDDIEPQKDVNTKETEQKPTGETLLKITTKKADNLSDWYSQVITKSEMIDYYDISGCYILRPWSYGIWEELQGFLDKQFKSDDVENGYFPMFVTEKALNTEKEHVEGFSPEVAWVTRSGTSELSEPIAIRPTSETIMYPAFSKWIRSHRDLPLKINQWTNIVRWEFKHPTPFIRTREFLWQEGHTAHSTDKEAQEQVLRILEFYARAYEEMLAVPVIKGVKSENEKFPGAKETTSIETLIPENGRAIQAATSHHLGQNFSKMFNIEFDNEQNQKDKAHQTSWGFTTRSIGVMVLFHGDDQGLVLPPRVAKVQVIIVPIIKKTDTEKTLAKCEELKQLLKQHADVRVQVDSRTNYTFGWKFNHWELKGVPIRIEVGPKDIEAGEVKLVRRFDGQKQQVKETDLIGVVSSQLKEIQVQMLENARQKLNNCQFVAKDWKQFMTGLNQRKMVFTPWCKIEECEEQVKEKSKIESKLEQEQDVQLTGAAKTLNIPYTQPQLDEGAVCFHCGKQATIWVNWGRSY